jgi:RimJ/RimL family protein N-acetyltransferase
MVEADRGTGDGWTFAMFERSSDDLVGMVRLDRTDRVDTGEIGYWVAIDRWGRGYATEASRRILAFGFGEVGFRRVRTYIMPANGPSRRVLTKLGFVPDGHGPVEAPARGGPVAMDFLVLERHAWTDHA